MTETARSERPLPQLIDVKLVHDGWIKKYALVYQLPNGEIFSYESVSRKSTEAYRAELEANARGEKSPADAVCVVPILPDGSVLLIREFRYPLNSWTIAFPAGLLEAGESLITCVDRELHEETGYRVRAELGEAAVRPLPQAGYSSMGMSGESVQIVIAYVEKDGEASPEPIELIEPFTLKREEIPTFLETNTIPIGTRGQLLLEIARHIEVL